MHSAVPPNDGGIALGQAVIANEILRNQPQISADELGSEDRVIGSSVHRVIGNQKQTSRK
jgi:hypothetical protein